MHGFPELPDYPFEPHFLDLNGQQYHYLDEGHGEPLLMVHGNPTWSFAWRRFVQEFSPRYRVIAVDHIGCGRSDKPQQYPYRLGQHVANLSHLIKTLDLKGVTLIAHDWGGAIGMGAAVAAPERFKRFMLCNTGAFRSQRIPLRIAACRIPLLGALGVRGANLFVRAALIMAVTRKLPAAVQRGYLAPYGNWQQRVAVQRFVEDIPLVESHPSYETLKQIEEGLAQFQTHPMLLAWGMQDWCFTPHFLEEFERRFPAAEVLRIPDAGHYVFEDAPAQLIARLSRFLEEHPLSTVRVKGSITDE